MKKILGILAALCLFCANLSAIEIKLAHAVNEQDSFHLAATKFKELTEKYTNGDVKVTIFPNAVLGDERTLLERMKMGIVDAGLITSGPIINFVPRFGVIDLPFLFRDSEHAYKVLDGPIGQSLFADMEKQGWKGLSWAERGFRNLTNSKRPVKSPDDLKGLKIRLMQNPVYVDSFKALGANAVPMAWTEALTALQQKTIDGQENPLNVIVSYKLDECQKYMSITRHAYAPAPPHHEPHDLEEAQRRPATGSHEGGPGSGPVRAGLRQQERGRLAQGPRGQGHDRRYARPRALPGRREAGLRPVRAQVRPGPRRRDHRDEVRQRTMSATTDEKPAKKSALTSLSDTANRWSERILFILMLLMVIIATAQVVCRFFFKALTWSEEFSCYLLVLASLVGTAVAFKRGSHIAVTALIEKLEPTAKKVMASFVDLLGLAFFGIVAWYGAVLMRTEASQVTPSMQISMKWIYLMYPLVGIVIMIHILDNLAAIWTKKEASK